MFTEGHELGRKAILGMRARILTPHSPPVRKMQISRNKQFYKGTCDTSIIMQNSTLSRSSSQDHNELKWKEASSKHIKLQQWCCKVFMLRWKKSWTLANEWILPENKVKRRILFSKSKEMTLRVKFSSSQRRLLLCDEVEESSKGVFEDVTYADGTQKPLTEGMA